MGKNNVKKSNIEIHCNKDINLTDIESTVSRKLEIAEEIIKKYLDSDSKSIKLQKAVIDLSNEDIKSPALDIGGSGEAIISKLKIEDLTVIDLDFDKAVSSSNVKQETMNACNMTFPNDMFRSVTIFYTLMYMNNSDLKKAITECYRVLEKGGELFIWDINLDFVTEEIIYASTEVHILTKTFKADYGTSLVKECRDCNYYINVLKTIGFSEICTSEKENSIYIKATK